MIHLLAILIVAIVASRDGFESLPIVRSLTGWQVAMWTLVPLGVVAVALELFTRWCGRNVDRSGGWMWVRLAEGALSAARITVLLFHLIAVFGLGWLDVVRSAIGNIVVVDEAIAALPAIAVFALGSASYYGIDRRLREASILRRMETSGNVPSLPSRWEYTWEQTRHHLLIVLVPAFLIFTWAESIDVLADRNPWLLDGLSDDQRSLALTGLHLIGVATVFVFAPFLLKMIWTTVPLGRGELRDRLIGLCRAQGVGCRDLLVWRTHTNMVNGAVIGVAPWVRYILLTDALLEQLPARQVEAVMAHEVAHARRHHLPWLLVMMVVSVTWAWLMSALTIDALLPDALLPAESPSPFSTDTGLLAALVVGVLVFGWISRRFEEQADAFAAQHLSGVTFARGSSAANDAVIQPEAAATMAFALAAVCELNHISAHRFSFRHGSIASRQNRLKRLIGKSARKLPIDRLVIGLKVATVIAGIGLVAMMLFVA